MKTKKLYIIGRRPENIPDNWIVFNAPRPMLGDKDWCGDFHHGIFYAAVDPDGYIPEKWMQKNCDLDGWVVEYVSEEAAIQMVFQSTLPHGERLFSYNFIKILYLLLYICGPSICIKGCIILSKNIFNLLCILNWLG